MIRVYDTVVDNTVKTLERYGATYRLQNVSVMGKQRIYTYQAPGMETIAVVPHFKKQWDAAYQIISKIGKGKSLTGYMQVVQMKIDKNAVIADISGNGGDDSKGILARYKDIELEIEFNGKQLILLQTFTIRDHNVFGNDVVVDFQEEEE